MTSLERQMKALQKHLKTLKTQANKAHGKARRRVKRIERRTRIQVERALRRAEPQVRHAVEQAALISRSIRVGVRAGAAAYRAGRAPRR